VGNYFPSLKPPVVEVLKALKSAMAGLPVLPDLQVVPFAALGSGESVLADAACKLYAVVLIKATAVATFSKLTDNATTSSDASSEFRFWQTLIDQDVWVDPTGQPFANGVTAQGNTTASGGGDSGVDGAHGFVVIGNP
jgi:hypothetical protein